MADPIETALRGCRYFAALPERAAGALARQSRRVALERGELLFSKGDPADGVYLLVAGEIAIEASAPSGQSVCFASLRPGAVFGELAALDGAARSADARARTRADLIKVAVAAFRQAVAENPAFATAVIRDLIGKLRRTDSQIEIISFRSLQARLAQLLLDLSSQGQDSIAATQAELGEMLSATREKVNGHLQTLQASYAISIRRGAIDIRDRKILTAFADAG
ncbi:MAG: Crp/Fnr family transcriptional regulator [Parvularculaceae bacterium]|nr:Crp/Fnr family transcriptional regulator [Parvularculaceae bacterium]